jgi:hypothetical protein
MRDEADRKFQEVINKICKELEIEWNDILLELNQFNYAFDLVTDIDTVILSAKMKHIHWLKTELEHGERPIFELIESFRQEALYKLEKGFLGIKSYEMFYRAALILYYDLKVEWERICEEAGEKKNE